MVKVTPGDVARLVIHCRKMVPGFKIHDGKRDSYAMNLADGIVYPFNPGFLDDYITTLAGAVFFPKNSIQRRPLHALEVTGHEFVHAYDAKRLTFPLFAAMYLSFISVFLVCLVAYGAFGSLFAFIPFGWAAVHAGAVKASFKLRRITGFPLLAASLMAAVGLSFWDDGWGAAWLLASMVFLLPLPAIGRTWAELRGYGASITFELEIFGRAQLSHKVGQFTGPAYYWMWPFAAWVARKLKSYETKAIAGDVDDPAYLHVLGFIKDLKTRQGLDR